MQERPGIGYVTVQDAADRRSWSGTLHHLLRALQEKADVEPLGPLEPWPQLVFAKAFNQTGIKLFGKRFNYRDSFLLSRAYGRMLGSKLHGRRFDLLVAPAGLATTAHLNTDIPIVYINDRCLAGALDYHKILKHLFPFSRREGLELEALALKNASLVIYGSHWAADAAKAAYPSESHKIHVVPFGANLEQFPPRPVARKVPADPLKLLFIGVKWEEKGGPIAYDTLLELKRRGVDARLVVCGCDPPAGLNDPHMIREGFLDKNIPAQRARLEEHLRTADLLIVPTRFEAYGIVFCEAAAYGVPVLATRTGGVPTIVVDGETGLLFNMEDGGKVYAGRIMELISDPEKWERMRHSARDRFEKKLNWHAFTRRLFDHAGLSGPINRER